MLEIFGKSPETQGAGVEVVGRGGGGGGGRDDELRICCIYFMAEYHILVYPIYPRFMKLVRLALDSYDSERQRKSPTLVAERR